MTLTANTDRAETGARGWVEVGPDWTLSRRRTWVGRLAALAMALAVAAALLPLLTLLWQVVSRGAGQLDAQFLTYSMRDVVGPGGGIYHAAVGTLLVTAAATVLSVPVGMLAAVYVVEYRGRLARPVMALVDVMTGIPSIVAGLFAYALFALFLGPGVRLGIGGAVALSVLMVPLVVRSTEAMLLLVPPELREGALALGVPRWRVIVSVVVPQALGGIATGVTLAVARIIGETAPLLIICGSTDTTNTNLFAGRMMTLPVFIYEQYKTPGVPPVYGIDRAWGAALVLTIIVVGLSLLARLVSHRFATRTRS